MKTESQWRGSLVVLLFSLYGLGVHRALYWFVCRMDPGFYTSWGASTVSLFGGLSVAAIFWGLVRRAAEDGVPGLGRFIVRCGWCGIVATVITFQLFYVLLAAVWASTATAGGTVASVANGFVLSCIDIQTYGLVPLPRILLFAFAYGGIAGVLIWLMRDRILFLPPRRDIGRRFGKRALGFGILGAILAWVPGLGQLLQLAAIVVGRRALVRSAKGEGGRWRAWTGLLLGCAGLLGYMVIVVVGLIMVTRGRR